MVALVCRPRILGAGCWCRDRSSDHGRDRSIRQLSRVSQLAGYGIALRPAHVVYAAYNRRYFDRRRGVTLLGTTADHYAGLHTIVITGTQPDAPYILDGLLDPQTSVRPREIVTDTAGYTDVIFGLFRILSYQYSPRLADAGAATFWRLNPTDYGPLNSLARHQINRALVEQHYDDLLRRRQPATAPHDRQPARPRATQPQPPPRVPRQGAAARWARREDDPPPRLLQRPAVPAAHPDAAQPRREPPRPRPRRLPRPPRRTTPALPPRPRRTTRRARPDRQRDRPLQHDLHPARARPPDRAGPHDRGCRPSTAQPARDRPHHPHRPVPNRAPRGATRPRHLPRVQHNARPRGLARFSARTLYRPPLPLWLSAPRNSFRRCIGSCW